MSLKIVALVCAGLLSQVARAGVYDDFSRILLADNETNSTLILLEGTAPAPPPGRVNATVTTSTIEISFTITGITFTDLSEADKTSISTEIMNKVVADLGVPASTVTVVLSAGSVKVEITVADAPAAAVTAVAAQDTSTQQTAYIAAVQEVVTANNITVTGTLGVTGYDTETTASSPSPPPPVSETPSPTPLPPGATFAPTGTPTTVAPTPLPPGATFSPTATPPAPPPSPPAESGAFFTKLSISSAACVAMVLAK